MSDYEMTTRIGAIFDNLSDIVTMIQDSVAELESVVDDVDEMEEAFGKMEEKVEGIDDFRSQVEEARDLLDTAIDYA